MKRLAIVFLACAMTLGTGAAFAADKESVYDRVMRTRTLKCGFFEENPFTIVDPNTNKHSGIANDLAETIAKQLGLKIQWEGVANFANMADDLRTGRYDAICASVFILPRAGVMDYTTPYVYVPTYGYTRVGDTRFDNNLAAVNNSKVTVALIDGEGSSTIVQQRYPKLKPYALPQMADISQMLLAVAEKKADIGFVLPTVYNQFQENNPGKLRRVPSKDPLHVFAVSFAIKPDEPAMKNLLNFMMTQLIVSGEMDRIVDKYEPAPGTFLHADKPYKAVK